MCRNEPKAGSVTRCVITENGETQPAKETARDPLAADSGPISKLLSRSLAAPLLACLLALHGLSATMSDGRFIPAEGEATLCGVAVETDSKTGLALSVSPVRIGGTLSQSLPQF